MERMHDEDRLDWAVKAGITEGTGMQEYVTKEEAVGMIHRALEYFFGQIIAALDKA